MIIWMLMACAGPECLELPEVGGSEPISAPSAPAGAVLVLSEPKGTMAFTSGVDFTVTNLSSESCAMAIYALDSPPDEDFFDSEAALGAADGWLLDSAKLPPGSVLTSSWAETIEADGPWERTFAVAICAGGEAELETVLSARACWEGESPPGDPRAGPDPGDVMWERVPLSGMSFEALAEALRRLLGPGETAWFDPQCRDLVAPDGRRLDVEALVLLQADGTALSLEGADSDVVGWLANADLILSSVQEATDGSPVRVDAALRMSTRFDGIEVAAVFGDVPRFEVGTQTLDATALPRKKTGEAVMGWLEEAVAQAAD